MTTVPTPVDLGRVLADHPLTASLDADTRTRLADVARPVVLERGDVLVRQGEPGEAAYLVAAGRLVATVDGVEVGVVTRGETVGEMALVTGEPRTATVVARRPSRLVRIGADDFADILAAHPQASRSLTSLLVERLERTLRGRPAWVAHATVVGVAVADRTDACHRFVRDLADALTRAGSRVAVAPDPDPGPGSDATGPDLRGEPRPGPGRASGSPARLRLLADLEVDHDVVLVRLEPADLAAPVDHGCDRTLLVCRSDGPVPDLAPGSATDLVLRHPPTIAHPRGTARWLDLLAPTGRHHHLREGSPEHLDGLARRLLHRERVLVLGGGGARGLAHLGTWRALREAGVGIDAVYGVSAGAVFGADVAIDRSPAEAIERAGELLIDGPSVVDLTVPVVALSSGRRITETIRDGFGGVDIEDLWRPYTCLSADLTTLTARVHDRGPLWRAIRASVAVPGVFPPLVEGEAVLVDGGVVDNLPVARARARYPGSLVISSDVGRRHEELTVDLPSDGIVGGLRTGWQRVGRGRQTPGLVQLLYRLTALGGGALEAEEGDLHIAHDLTGVGMFDFAGARPAIEAGYRLARERLEACAPMLAAPVA